MAEKVQQPQSNQEANKRKRNRAANGILTHACRQKEHEIVESNKHPELSRGPTTPQKL